jgi:hypothetical protein
MCDADRPARKLSRHISVSAEEHHTSHLTLHTSFPPPMNLSIFPHYLSPCFQCTPVLAGLFLSCCQLTAHLPPWRFLKHAAFPKGMRLQPARPLITWEM